MKKTALYVMAAFLSLTFVPGGLSASTAPGKPEPSKITEIMDSKAFPRNTREASPVDLSNIDETMKQELKKEMAERQERHGGGVVVISGTALLIIIILLILLL